MLWRLRVDGGTARTRAAFDAAIQANPYVVSYLLDPDSIPFDRPPHFALHSREEAAYVAETLVDGFAATDGALEWLATQAPPSPRVRGADDADRHSEAHATWEPTLRAVPMRIRDRHAHVKGFRTATPVGS